MAIISCVSAFIPFYAILFCIILGVVSILCSFFNLHSNQKKIKEISIVSIIVSILSFFICIIVNVYVVFFLNTAYNENTYFSDLSKDYFTYKFDDTIKDEYLEFEIENEEYDKNTIDINYIMTFYGEQRVFSIFNFYILDESTDHIYYITYEKGSEYIYNTNIGNSENVKGKMKFKLNENYNMDKLYLIYKDNYSKFKVKIK